MSKIKFTTFILAFFLIFSNAFAAHQDEGEGIQKEILTIANIKTNPNEVILEVHGVVCSFCTIGIQKKLSKIKFIDRSKYIKGSEVNIENQQVTIAIKSGLKPDLEVIYEAIKSGGYKPVKAFISDKNGKIATDIPKNE
jgi:hypothetical protein